MSWFWEKAPDVPRETMVPISLLNAERDRYDAMVRDLTGKLLALKKLNQVEPTVIHIPPPPQAVAPSLDVLVEEYAMKSPQPALVRRELQRFIALKTTEGRSNDEIAALIRRGNADDAEEED